MTTSQANRTENEWGRIANDSVTVEQIGGAVYGFASEIGARRIADKMKAGRVGYSQNLDTWFYVNQ